MLYTFSNKPNEKLPSNVEEWFNGIEYELKTKYWLYRNHLNVSPRDKVAKAKLDIVVEILGDDIDI